MHNQDKLSRIVMPTLSIERKLKIARYLLISLFLVFRSATYVCLELIIYFHTVKSATFHCLLSYSGTCLGRPRVCECACVCLRACMRVCMRACEKEREKCNTVRYVVELSTRVA